MTFDFGARWIALTWTPTFDGNRPVAAFNIYIQIVNETENFTFLIQLDPEALMRDGGSFRFNITNQSVVFPFIQYSFRVDACNEIGCSNQTDPSEVIRTNEDRELKIVGFHNGHMHVFNNVSMHTHSHTHTHTHTHKDLMLHPISLKHSPFHPHLSTSVGTLLLQSYTEVYSPATESLITLRIWTLQSRPPLIPVSHWRA